jgi:tRNA threonylcarbamoyl adenosine modification protein YeaZ
MPSLIIDTSTDSSLIALVRNDQLLSSQVTPHYNRLSKELLPSIQNLLKANQLSPSDLSTIAVGTGPGSYTGTRLGCAVAKSLAFGLNIAVKPFHSPLAFLPNQEGCFLFLLPTRAGPYYLLRGVHAHGRALIQSTALIPENALSVETQTADFLICSPSHTPRELHTKPLFAPCVNLLTLSQSLEPIEALPPEKIALHYLHTPS